MKPRARSTLTILDGRTVVECDGPVEAMDAVQRDVFEVRMPEPDPELDAALGDALADVLLELGLV